MLAILALITEMSREITSTLDLDRVLRSVVNLASRALTFDRGALALYEHGVCDIRAVAGADGVDAKDPRSKISPFARLGRPASAKLSTCPIVPIPARTPSERSFRSSASTSSATAR